MRPDPEHDDPSHAEGAAPSRSQYGALCWRKKGKHVEVLLITSRDTGRWLVPKGWPIDGLGGAGSAAREAFEEAGVEGEIAEQPLGYYSYVKARARQGKSREDLPCVVAVYPMRVGKLLDRYPERGERRRKWFTAAKAAAKVAEPELRQILAGCEAVLLSGHPADADRAPAAKA
ncbi:NUDIX hydrolase [Aliigemmobacter aestuarii]|uniref:NUDIX hydrolase n=2 Tax=Aliigemmobacter aestuarii TaxID=1445661 RepID=A0A4S3MT96_9RHOB|nr:NUDIX hydrolase [Gemmobacter aestuarii]